MAGAFSWNGHVVSLETGLAAEIFLDATIVQALLVPATVSPMGKWNWWLPRWLERFAPAPDGARAVQPSAGD